MAVNNVRKSVAYGFTDALLGVGPEPIISQRAPSTSDKAQLGTVWVEEDANAVFILSSVVANTATWVSVGGGGGAGVFTSLTATTGNITATSGNIIATAGSITASTAFFLGAGPRIIAGAGSPNGVTAAAQGSLYLNTTGNSSSTRAFINSDGNMAWVAVTTAT